MKKKRPLDKMIISSLMISPIVLGGVLLAGQQATQATEADGKWEARSIEQIKKDVEGKKEYTIVWGDTLSGISLATNVTMDKLASFVFCKTFIHKIAEEKYTILQPEIIL